MTRHLGELVAQQRLDVAGHVVGVVANLEDAARRGGVYGKWLAQRARRRYIRVAQYLPFRARGDTRALPFHAVAVAPVDVCPARARRFCF
jgi:hypothetical protein